MKAIYLTNGNHSSTSDEGVAAVEKVPIPTPNQSEIQVRVFAAGLTPTETEWYPSRHLKNGETRVRPIPGHEFSGVVSAVGSDVTSVAVGDEIFGMNDWFADGAMAEYCVTLPCSIAPKPFGLSHVDAAAVPIGALTAWQGLFERLNLLESDRILIQGAAGAVGTFAVQLAHRTGAYVVATAAPQNFELVRDLGADEVIDYRSDYFSSRTGSFDAVFDVVGGATLDRSWPLLKPQGQLVTIAVESGASSDERTKRAFFLVEPNQRHLLEISSMLEARQLRVVVDTVVPFHRAPEALTGRLDGRKGRGKIVVEVAVATQPAKIATV